MWVQVVGHNLLCWVFLLCFSILSLSLPLSGLGSKPTFFGGGSLNQGQGSRIWTRISFSDSLLSLGFGQIELLNVAWVLHESGDAGWKACTRSQMKVCYFIIVYTSIFIRLSHLYQECHGQFIVIANEEEMG